MFERFTDRARRVLVLAQEEARLLDHNFIGTEHLLLGLIQEGDGVAGQALLALGIDLEATRTIVEETIGTGHGSTGSPPFTPRAKKVLELSLREALQLGHNYIGTEHILLGLVREGEGVAAQTLVSLGADLPIVRQQVIQMLSGFAPSGGSFDPPETTVPSGTFIAETRRARLWRRAATVRPRQPGARSRSQSEPAAACAGLRGEVDLSYRANRLTGTVAGANIDVGLVMPGGEGSAEGTFAGAEVAATWRLAANDMWDPDVPFSLHGTFGGASMRVLGWFHLGPELVFDHGHLEGYLDGEPIAAYIEAVDREGDSGSFTADGYLADAGFSVSGGGAPSDSGLAEWGLAEWGLVGSVAGRPVRLDVAPGERSAGDEGGGSGEESNRSRTLKGAYDGPAALLLLFAGPLILFG